MASEIRVNQIQNRSGLSTVTFSDTGVVISGVTTVGILSVTGNLNVTGSNGLVVAAGSAAAPSISPSGDSNTGIFFPSPDTVAIGEGGSEVLRVDSAGRVGIATNNPASTLDVGGEITIRRTAAGSEGGQINFARASDNATAWYLDVYGSTSTPSLRFIDNTAVRMQIDGSGRVTIPSQPAFLAYSTGVSVTGGWSNLSSSLTTEAYDIGGNYGSSTAGRFVAPVAGRYLFYFGGFANGNTVNERYAVCARVNGGNLNYISGGSYAISDTPLSGYSVVHNLAVNDYVELFYFTAIANTWGGATHYVYWGGYLLG